MRLDVVIDHGRGSVPDAVLALDSYLPVSDAREIHPRQVLSLTKLANVMTSMKQDRTLDKLVKSVAETLRRFALRVRLPPTEPSNA